MKSYNANTVQTAQLMEEKPQDIATDCQVWKLDKEHYEKTGEVRKLEFLRTEKAQTWSAYRKGSHFVWDKEESTCLR